MNSRLLHLSALGLALAPCYASALGFGEIVLHSRVGEPLLAEVPILASAGETIDTACFSLATIPGSDLPVVSAARPRLQRNGASYRLQITGTRPIAEPIFIIGLRANCGVDLQRDYVLMPSAPLLLASADNEAAPTASTTGRKAGAAREWRARAGDTLESIAESQAPENIMEQRRLLAALKRANPGLTPEQLLADGTPVRMPNLRQRLAAERDSEAEPASRPRRPQSSEAPPARAKKTVRTEPPSDSPGMGGGDRIVLGAPPDELNSGEKAVAPGKKASEMEERMLKLETTLQLLNQEVDKLNSALTLTTEALAIQNKLQAAPSTQAPAEPVAAIRAAVATPSVANRASQNNWLELLLSAIVGGGIAAGMAHYLGRRRPSPGEGELPLAISGYHPEAHPRPLAPLVPEEPEAAAKPSLEPAARQPRPEVDIPLDSSTAEFDDGESVDVNYCDGDSALALAEIMLSFGRVRGAAETLALHIEESSPENIQPWTMLLDLYRRGDMPVEFSTLAERMREKFNVHVPAWEDSSTPVSGLKSLEDYAHIVWRTANSWGKQECLDYLYELVHDTRSGKRSGFPLEVVEEIALLMRVLEEGYGLKRPG